MLARGVLGVRGEMKPILFLATSAQSAVHRQMPIEVLRTLSILLLDVRPLHIGQAVFAEIEARSDLGSTETRCG